MARLMRGEGIRAKVVTHSEPYTALGRPHRHTAVHDGASGPGVACAAQASGGTRPVSRAFSEHSRQLVWLTRSLRNRGKVSATDARGDEVGWVLLEKKIDPARTLREGSWV